jgi:hypothetical protein
LARDITIFSGLLEELEIPAMTAKRWQDQAKLPESELERYFAEAEVNRKEKTPGWSGNLQPGAEHGSSSEPFLYHSSARAACRYDKNPHTGLTRFVVNCLIYSPEAVAHQEAAYQRDLAVSIRLELRPPPVCRPPG